jgi:hypothetical protein
MTKKPVTEAHVQRPRDLSHGRQPLRLEIARRRKRTHAGNEKFVTEVRYGDSTALFVPWSAERGGSPASVLTPGRSPGVETLAA